MSRRRRRRGLIGALVARLLRRRQASSTPAGSAPATRRRRRATCGSGSTPLEVDKHAVRRHPGGGAAPSRRALGRAEDRGRGRFPRLDRRPLVRQAAFKGVREDKPAKRGGAGGRPRLDTDEGRSKAQQAEARGQDSRRPDTKPREASRRQSQAASERKARGRQSDVRFTHPDRVYWADVGVTKQDLADYYRAVWDWMAPHVVGRPLALVRCPDGTAGECFFQKHASAGLDDEHLRTVIDTQAPQVDRDRQTSTGCCRWCRRACSKCTCAARRSTASSAATASCSISIPARASTGPDIVAAAREVRERLAAIKLESFVKTIGRQGPARGAADRAASTGTTPRLSCRPSRMAMAADEPDRYVAKMTKSLRGGKHLHRLSAQFAGADRGRAPIRRARAPARRCRCR